VLAGVGDFAEDGLRLAEASVMWFGGLLLLLAGLVLFGIASLRARVLDCVDHARLLADPPAGPDFAEQDCPSVAAARLTSPASAIALRRLKQV
jgi:hypothetical protein